MGPNLDREVTDVRSRARILVASVLAVAIGALLAGGIGGGPAAAQQAPQSRMELIRVADDVYSFRYASHITMFIVTDEGVVTADPLGQQNPEAPNLLKAAIRSVTDQPVRYVIITHWGEDHGMGGAVFADTATFIAHPITAQRMAAANDPTSPVPDVLVSDRLSLLLGGKEIEVIYTGRTQGDDYLIVSYPARRLVFTVDFVRERGVAFRSFTSGHIEEWIQALNWIEANLQPEIVLLGHPPAVASAQALVDTRQYLVDLMAAVRNARAAGLADNSEAMVAAVRAELAPQYATWGNFDNFLAENIVGATRTMPAR
jgi:glyoxylase-like metal-dependent hydrolase (beta-lactamase superfamily II)